MKLILTDLNVDTFPTLPGEPETGVDGFPPMDPASARGVTCFCY